MLQTIEKQILNKIKKAARGTLFFASDFIRFGNNKSILKALERLASSGELIRVTRGIYVRPVKDKILGIVLPDIEVLARAIARRDRARIIPAGAYAVYKLGLSVQVPMNIAYYTDGSARKIKIDGRVISFKKASARILSASGSISSLALQAFKYLGKEGLNAEEEEKLINILNHEIIYHLKHDMVLAPVWGKKIFRKIIAEKENAKS